MLVVEVDVVGLELRERTCEGAFDVGWLRVGDVGERFWVARAELGSEEDFATPAGGGEPTTQDGFG